MNKVTTICRLHVNGKIKVIRRYFISEPLLSQRAGFTNILEETSKTTDLQ